MSYSFWKYSSRQKISTLNDSCSAGYLLLHNKLTLCEIQQRLSYHAHDFAGQEFQQGIAGVADLCILHDDWGLRWGGFHGWSWLRWLNRSLVWAVGWAHFLSSSLNTSASLECLRCLLHSPVWNLDWDGWNREGQIGMNFPAPPFPSPLFFSPSFLFLPFSVSFLPPTPSFHVTFPHDSLGFSSEHGDLKMVRLLM